MARSGRDASSTGFAIGLLLVVAGVGVVLALTPALEGPNAPLWGSLFTQAAWILLAFYGAALARPPGLGDRLGLGRGELPTSTSLVLVLGFVALSGGLHQGLVSLELRETGALAEIDQVVREARTRPSSLLLAFLALGIAPGFGEEILFRGFLQRGLVPRIGAFWGVMLAAAIFGLAHFDPIHTSLAFFLGAYLGVAAHLAGSIRPAILCHVVNNTLGIVGPALIPSGFPAGGAWTIPLLLGLAGASLHFASRQQGLPRGESSRYSGAGESPTREDER
jgi:membrane protease YdiL (CAAX protease family)